jgi:hypothetical protein
MQRQREQELVKAKRAMEQARAETDRLFAEVAVQKKDLERARELVNEVRPDRKEKAGRAAEDQRLRELAERYRDEAQKMQHEARAHQAALQEALAKHQAVAQQAQAEVQALRDQLVRAQRLAEDQAVRARAAKDDGARGAAAQKARDEAELLKAQLDIKQAELAAAKLSADGLARHAAQLDQLHRTGAAPQATYLKAQTEANAALAQVRVKEAEVRAAEVALKQAMRRLGEAEGGRPAAAPAEDQRLKELDAKLDALRREIQALRQGQGPKRP